MKTDSETKMMKYRNSNVGLLINPNEIGVTFLNPNLI